MLFALALLCWCDVLSDVLGEAVVEVQDAAIRFVQVNVRAVDGVIAGDEAPPPVEF